MEPFFSFPTKMDRWSRNLRLYETLKGMGLIVSPITEPGDPTKIRQMIVSADLPSAFDVDTAVDAAARRLAVESEPRSQPGSPGNVVNFPTKL
jgi:hypothetical protein